MPDDDPFGVVGVGAFVDVGREDRCRCLLRLQDERVVLVPPLEDKHKAACPDAADADDLEGEVHEAIALQEGAPVLGHRGAVVLEDLLQGRGAAQPLEVDMGDDGRIVEDHPASVHDSRQLLEGTHPVALPGLAEDGFKAHATGGTLAPSEPARRLGGLSDIGLGDRGIPDGHEAHPGVAVHPLAVAADGRHRRLPVLGDAEAPRPAGDDDARGEPFDVPLPGCWKRLIEVVGVEHERSLGRREESEVAEVGVAARLDDDAGARGGREVESHHGRGTAVVRERRFSHPLVAEGHEVLEPVLLLGGQDRDRVAVAGGFEGGVIHPWDALACRPPERSPLARWHPRPRCPGGALGREIGLPRSVERGRVLGPRSRSVRPSLRSCRFGHCRCPRTTAIGMERRHFRGSRDWAHPPGRRIRSNSCPAVVASLSARRQVTDDATRDAGFIRPGG